MRGAQLRRQRRRRAFLDHLLLPPLQRALALEERDDVLVVVREDLDLDVPRTLDEAFDVQGAVAERGLGVPARGLNRGRRVFPGRTICMPMPPPPDDGLSRAGYPTRSIAAMSAVSACESGASPGTTGTPARCISARASIFDPMR